MLLLWIVLLVVIVYGLLKLYAHRQYWSKRGVPGPKPHLIWGNLGDVARSDRHEALLLMDMTQKYGAFYGYQEGMQNVLVISDLSMIDQIFVKQFENFTGRRLPPFAPSPDDDNVNVFLARGMRWKRLRAITSPAFSTAYLKKMLPTVEDSVKEMLAHLSKQAQTGASFECTRYYREFTMDVIGRLALGQEGSIQFRNSNVELFLNVFERPPNDPLSMLIKVASPLREMVAAFLNSLPKTGLPFNSINERVDRIVRQKRDSNTEVSKKDINNFIDFFLQSEAPNEIIDELRATSKDEFKKGTVKISKRLTAEEVVAQCATMLFAGFDTTATSLAYTTYFLMKHPDVQNKLRAEIDAVCGNEDISWGEIQQCHYLDMVVKETLRLYPVATGVISHECTRTCVVNGVEIEKGTLVFIDVFSVHYDKKLWGDDADCFIPERWENESRVYQQYYMPFGVGPRQCVGMRLALMEEKLALAHILKNFEILPCAQSEDKLEYGGNLVISPKSVTIQMRPRRSE